MIGRKDWYNLILFMPLVLVLLLYSHETLDPVLHIRFLGGYLYLFFLGLFFARKKSMRCFRIDKWFLIFFAGYLITSMLSLFFYYKNVGEGIFEWYRLLMPLLVVCLLQSFIERETDISDHVALVFISCLVIAAIVGFYQYYILYTTSIINHNSIYKVSSLFAHKNIFAEVMLICFPFGIYYFVSGKGPVKYIGLLTSAISLFFITILLSRAIWVAFVLAGVISLVFLFFINRKEGKLFLNVKKVGVMAILLLLMIGFSVYIFSQQDTAVTFYKQFTSTFNFSHDSTKDRIELWKKSILIFKENPWIGKGLGSWKVEILKYGNLELKSIDNVTFYQRPHNDFVWILAEQGLLAFIFYLSIPGLLYYYMFRLLKREISFKEKSFILAVLYALTAFLLFSLFSFPRERIEHVVFFSLLCFSVVQLHNKYATPSCNFTLAQNKMFIILSPLIVLGLCIAFIRFNSEVHNKKAFVARQQLNWELLKQEIDASDNFFYRFDPTSTPLL